MGTGGGWSPSHSEICGGDSPGRGSACRGASGRAAGEGAVRSGGRRAGAVGIGDMPSSTGRRPAASPRSSTACRREPRPSRSRSSRVTELVTFDVTVDPTTPPGATPSLVCELAGEVGGRKVVYRVGRGGVFTVNVPGGVKTDATGKPLSPLEALRLRRRSDGERSGVLLARRASEGNSASLLARRANKTRRRLTKSVPVRYPAMRMTVLALLIASPALAADPVKLVVAPTSVELTGARDRQGLTVQASFADGSTRDVTATAEMTLDKPVATVTNGFLAPAADGSARLTVKHAGLTAAVPVVVKDHRATGKLSFRNDVMPVFTKSGCNTGKCHGSAVGQGRVPAVAVRVRPGRRSVPDHPRDGRPTRQPGHPRGLPARQQGDRKGPAHRRAAIRAGQRETTSCSSAGWRTAPRPTRLRHPRPIGIEVFPKEAVFAAKGEAQRVVVRAKYSDGTDRDVTRFAVFVGNNDAAATVTEAGVITATGPGEAFLLARFDEFTQGTRRHRPARHAVHSARDSGVQLHRHPRPGQAEQAARHPVGRLHRRGVRPPSLPRPDRPVADSRRAREVPGRCRREEAREAGRLHSWPARSSRISG